MLSRFIAATIRARGGDASEATLTDPDGVGASRIRPSTRTPAANSASRNAPTVKSAGSSITNSNRRVPQREPIHPVAWTEPSRRARTEIRDPALPATVRTEFWMGKALDDGSSPTDAARPAAPGATVTQTRLSLSERADTR